MNRDEAPARLLDQPLYLLSLLGRQARAAAAEALAKVRLKLGHMAVLAVLTESGPSSQREIGRLIGKDPSDVVVLLDEMETLKLVRRDPDPSDRRRHLVTVTTRGARTFDRAESVLEAATSAFFEDLDPGAGRRLEDLAGRSPRGRGPSGSPPPQA